MILNVIAAALGFAVFSLALWWLIPLAFPLLAFTF